MIIFPILGQRPMVDLHYSYRNIRGKTVEPISITSLGWTCIGDPNSGQENRNDLDNIVRKFLKIENVNTPS